VASFAEVLSELRTAKGLSQSRLAHGAGFDHSHVSRLEAGKRQPSREAVLALANVLGLNSLEIDRLLVAAGYRPLDDSSLFADEPAIVQALHILRDPRISEPIRANFREVLKLLVEQWSTSN